MFSRVHSLLRWFRFFPVRCETRLTSMRLSSLGVDFATDDTRRFSADIGYAYMPTYAAVFRDGIRKLPIPIREIKLFDAGCGKGPILYAAKKLGIQKVAGVELSDELCAICMKNMQTLGYHDIVIFPEDATQLRDELDDYNVFYMFNPFPAEPMRTFMRSIAESVKRNRRVVYGIYHNPLHGDVCKEEGFVLLKEFLTHTYFKNDKPTWILEYRASQ